MSMLAPPATRTLSATEFERRVESGEQIRLLWIPEVNELLVEQLDLESKGIVLRAVPHGQGLDAFRNPDHYPPCRPDYLYQVTAGEIEIPTAS
jgi:hypothetical protein